MNGMIRRKSDLAIFERISPNKNVPRTKTVRRLTPHCVAGNLSAQSTLALSMFQAGGGASCSYAIGSDGVIGLGVEETNRPWTTSSSANDHEAITVEIANNGGASDWRMSDAAINAWLDLSVDICRFYGYSKVRYEPKPANISGAILVESWIQTWQEPDVMIITLHNWYAAKACPGPYFIRQLPWLVKEINKRLQDPACTPEEFVGENATPPSSTPSATPTTAGSYMVRITANALNIRKGPGTTYQVVDTLINDKNAYTIIEEAEGAGAPKWGKLKSGIGWIALNYTTKV